MSAVGWVSAEFDAPRPVIAGDSSGGHLALDPLHDEGHALAHTLRDAGVAVIGRCEQGMARVRPESRPVLSAPSTAGTSTRANS